jgi:uncharacterized protein
MHIRRTYQRIAAPVIAALFLGIVVILPHISPVIAQETAGEKMQTIPVVVGSKTIRAVLANSPQSRIQGLLGWNSIDEETGMLLDFIVDIDSAVHMEGMKFPIDAIWIDSKGEIKLIYNAIQPNKGIIYPTIVPCRYCLEVKAGFCKKYGIQVGQKIRFSEN